MAYTNDEYRRYGIYYQRYDKTPVLKVKPPTPVPAPPLTPAQRQAQAQQEADRALVHLIALLGDSPRLGVPGRPTNPEVERFMLNCGVKFDGPR